MTAVMLLKKFRSQINTAAIDGMDVQHCTKVDLILLSATVIIIYLLTANHIPLGSSTRYYEVSREMVETGNWLVPQLAYVPYVEKPPLVYWLGAAGRLISDHPYFTSLPSLFATLICVLTTYLFGCQWRNRTVGITAAFLLAGASFSQAMAGVLTTDPLLAATCCLAIYCWWRWDRSEQQCSLWIYGCYAAIACGWLTKGPIALALPAIGIALYAALGGGLFSILSTLIAMKPWWGVAIIMLINLPWTLALWLQDPRLVEFFYVRINYDAFFHGTYNHPGPWWYYLPVLAACLAPFSIILLPVIAQSLWSVLRSLRWQVDGSRVTTHTDHTHLFIACMIIGPLLFLSISSSKLGTYLLPIAPFLCLLSAEMISRWTKIPRWATALIIIQASIVTLAVALIPLALIAIHESLEQGHELMIFGVVFAKEPQLSEVDWSYSWHLLGAGGILLVAAITSVVMIMRDHIRWSLAALSLGTTCVLALMLPAIDELLPRIDATPLARIVHDNQSLAHSTDDIILLHETAVHDYEILLTLQRRLGIVGGARETGVGFFVQAHAKDTPLPDRDQPITHPYLVSGDNTVHPWLWSTTQLINDWKSTHRVWLIADASLLSYLESLQLQVFVIDRARRKALFSNQPFTSMNE